MDARKKLIAKIKSLAGGPEMLLAAAAELEAFDSDLDDLKADAVRAKRLSKEVDTLRAAQDDPKSAEAVTKLTSERDQAVADLASERGVHRQSRLKSAIADKLGVTDPKKAKRALDAFLADYLGDADFDAEGNLPGIEKSMKAFKEKESFFFDAVEAPTKPNEGGRQGGVPAPAKASGKAAGQSQDEKIAAWREQLSGGKTK